MKKYIFLFVLLFFFEVCVFALTDTMGTPIPDDSIGMGGNSSSKQVKADSDPLFFLIDNWGFTTIHRIQSIGYSIVANYISPIFLIPLGILYSFLLVLYLLKSFFSGRLNARELVISCVAMILVFNFYGGRKFFDGAEIIDNIRSDVDNVILPDVNSTSVKGVQGFFMLYSILTEFPNSFSNIIADSNVAAFKTEIAKLSSEGNVSNSLSNLLNAIDPNQNKKLSSSSIDRIFYFLYLLIHENTCKIQFSAVVFPSIQCPQGYDNGGFIEWIIGSLYLLFLSVTYIAFTLYLFYINIQFVFMGVLGFVLIIFLPFDWGRPAFYGWLKDVTYFVFLKCFVVFGVIYLFYASVIPIGDYFTVFQNSNRSGISAVLLSIVLAIFVSIFILLNAARLASFTYKFIGMGHPPKNILGSGILGAMNLASVFMGKFQDSFSNKAGYADTASNVSVADVEVIPNTARDFSANNNQVSWEYIGPTMLSASNRSQIGFDSASYFNDKGSDDDPTGGGGPSVPLLPSPVDGGSGGASASPNFSSGVSMVSTDRRGNKGNAIETNEGQVTQPVYMNHANNSSLSTQNNINVAGKDVSPASEANIIDVVDYSVSDSNSVSKDSFFNDSWQEKQLLRKVEQTIITSSVINNSKATTEADQKDQKKDTYDDLDTF